MEQVTQYLIEAIGSLQKARERVDELKSAGQAIGDDFEMIINNLLITATTLRQVAMGIIMPVGYGASASSEISTLQQAPAPYSYPIELRAVGGSSKPTSPLLLSYPAIPDHFYAGEYPGAKDEEQARNKITEMIDFGIDVFIDLTEVGELEPYAHLLPSWVIHERHPFPDNSTPPDHEFTKKVITSINQHLVNGKIVYLHCWGGIGRTGTIMGCWLASTYSLSPGSVVSELDETWKPWATSNIRPSTHITDEQRAYIQSWELICDHARAHPVVPYSHEDAAAPNNSTEGN